MSKNKTNIDSIDSDYYADLYHDNEYKYMSELIMGKNEDELINDVINDLHIGPITIMYVDDWLMAHPNTYLTIESLIPYIISALIDEDDYSDASGVILQLKGKIDEDDYQRLLEAMANSKEGVHYLGDIIMRAGISTEEMIKKYYKNFTMQQITDAWCGYNNLRTMLFTHVIYSNNVELFMDTINGCHTYEKSYYDWTLNEVYQDSHIDK